MPNPYSLDQTESQGGMKFTSTTTSGPPVWWLEPTLVNAHRTWTSMDGTSELRPILPELYGFRNRTLPVLAVEPQISTLLPKYKKPPFHALAGWVYGARTHVFIDKSVLNGQCGYQSNCLWFLKIFFSCTLFRPSESINYQQTANKIWGSLPPPEGKYATNLLKPV